MSYVFPSLLSALALIKIFFCYHTSRFPCVTCPMFLSFFPPAVVLGISIFCSVLDFFQANSSPASPLLFMLPSGSSYNLSRWKEICLKHYSTYQSADNPLLYSLRWKHWHRTAISVRVKTIKSSLVNNILFFLLLNWALVLYFWKRNIIFQVSSNISLCCVCWQVCGGGTVCQSVPIAPQGVLTCREEKEEQALRTELLHIPGCFANLSLSLSPGSEWQKLPTPALQSNCCSPNCCTQNEGVFFITRISLFKCLHVVFW